MFDPYADLYTNKEDYYRRTGNCSVCDNTGEVTAMHRVTGSIYEFKCSCYRGFERFKNPINPKTGRPTDGVTIAPEWGKAIWVEGRMKSFVKYDPSLLPSLNQH
jgi:hypothetical protein